jgi:hypothetical protein
MAESEVMADESVVHDNQLNDEDYAVGEVSTPVISVGIEHAHNVSAMSLPIDLVHLSE